MNSLLLYKDAAFAVDRSVFQNATSLKPPKNSSVVVESKLNKEKSRAILLIVSLPARDPT